LDEIFFTSLAFIPLIVRIAAFKLSSAMEFISTYGRQRLFHMLLTPALVLTPANPRINGLLVETPDPTDPDSRNFPLGGVLANGDFVEPEILGDFLGGHYLGHRVGLQVCGIPGGLADLAE
jgi:hypothetical protein